MVTTDPATEWVPLMPASDTDADETVAASTASEKVIVTAVPGSTSEAAFAGVTWLTVRLDPPGPGLHAGSVGEHGSPSEDPHAAARATANPTPAFRAILMAFMGASALLDAGMPADCAVPRGRRYTH
jgi:hypothetical protein